MENKIFGYARVSTRGQNEMRQVDDFLKIGIEERSIFVDKASSRTMNRPMYQTLKNVCVKEIYFIFIV